jgi:O-antigen/teichoic acid export membrane protein
LTVLATPVLARALGPNSYGLLALVTTIALVGGSLLFGWAEVLAVRTLVGLGVSVEAFLGALIAPAFIALCSLVIAVSIAGLFTKEWLLSLLTGGCVLTYGVMLFTTAALRARDRPGAYNILSTIGSGSRYLLGVPAVLVGGGTVGILGAWLIGGVVAAVGTVNALEVRLRRVRPQHFPRAMLKFAAPVLLVSLGLIELSIVDRLLLGVFSSTKVVGEYALGYSLVDQSSVLIFSVLLAAQFPRLLRTYDEHGAAAAQVQLRAAIVTLLAVLTPLTLVMVTFGGHIVLLLGGDRYQHANLSYIPWVAFGVAFHGVAQYVFIIFQQLNQTRPWAVAVILGALTNIGFNSVLIPFIGALGAGISTFGGYGVMLACGVYLSARVPSRPLAVRRLVPYGVAASVALGVAITLRGLPWPMACAGMLSVYLMVLWFQLRHSARGF